MAGDNLITVDINKEFPIRGKKSYQTSLNTYEKISISNDFCCDRCKTNKNKYTKKLCRKCYNHSYYKEYYKDNKQKFLDKATKRYQEKKEICLQDMKEYAKKHRRERLKYYNDYYQKNKEKMSLRMKENYEKNKIRYNKVAYKRKKTKLKTDPYFKLINNLRARISTAIRSHKGTKHTPSLELLGTDIETVRKHLADQFEPGMSWRNQGKWHIDHIIPCDTFDLRDKEQQKICFHYTNLQPMWSTENIRKATTIEE